VRRALILIFMAACPGGLKRDPLLEADGHYLAGTSAYLKGDLAEAHQHFDEVKRLNPSDRRLPAAEGEVFVSEGKMPEAIAAFEEGARRDPKRSTTWSRLAALYALKNDDQKASEAVSKALALNPRDFDALEVAASVALKLGALDEAVKRWSEASESAPEGDRVALVQKATAALMRAKRPTDALAVLQRAKKNGITSGDLLSELGDRLVDAGQPEEAIAAYTEAVALAPNDPTLWQLIGELELKQGRAEKAIAAFHVSLKVRDRGVVHVALAKLCQATREQECVTHELDAALKTASGEELLETIDLSDLLVSVGRARDALSLLSAVSEEPEQKANLALHLRVAQLARSLKENGVSRSACVRATALGASRCP